MQRTMCIATNEQKRFCVRADVHSHTRTDIGQRTVFARFVVVMNYMQHIKQYIDLYLRAFLLRWRSTISRWCSYTALVLCPFCVENKKPAENKWKKREREPIFWCFILHESISTFAQSLFLSLSLFLCVSVAFAATHSPLRHQIAIWKIKMFSWVSVTIKKVFVVVVVAVVSVRV